MTDNRQSKLHVERVHDQPLGRTQAGRFFIPLRIFAGDGEPEEAHLVMSGPDTENLLRDLARLFGGTLSLGPIGGAA
ncbi:hypothetical protein [Streptomyces sp. NPDC037389]|uniref:hypothetical protein n=1 Tax=Streptomyces sp. NPDC037389 TaxID=3155369 RepID=UPI0033CE0C98